MAKKSNNPFKTNFNALQVDDTNPYLLMGMFIDEVYSRFGTALRVTDKNDEFYLRYEDLNTDFQLNTLNTNLISIQLMKLDNFYNILDQMETMSEDQELKYFNQSYTKKEIEEIYRRTKSRPESANARFLVVSIAELQKPKSDFNWFNYQRIDTHMFNRIGIIMGAPDKETISLMIDRVSETVEVLNKIADFYTEYQMMFNKKMNILMLGQEKEDGEKEDY